MLPISLSASLGEVNFDDMDIPPRSRSCPPANDTEDAFEDKLSMSCVSRIETCKKMRFEQSPFVTALTHCTREPENREVLQATIHALQSLCETRLPLVASDREALKAYLDALDGYVTKHAETRSTSEALDAQEIWPRGLPREREIRCMYNGNPGREMGVAIDWIYKTIGYQPQNEIRQAKERELHPFLSHCEHILGTPLQKELVDILVEALSEKAIDALNRLKTTLENPTSIEHFCLLVAQQFMRLGVDNPECKSVANEIATKKLTYSRTLSLERCIFEDGSDLLALVHILERMIESEKIKPREVNVYIGRLDQIQNRFRTCNHHLGRRISFIESKMPFYHASAWPEPIQSRYRYGVSMLVEEIQKRQLDKVSLQAVLEGDDVEVVRSETRSRLLDSGSSQHYVNFVDSELQKSLSNSLSQVRETRYRSLALSSNPQYARFYCPITLEVMRNPVTAADGQNYEEAKIKEWIERAKARGHKPLSPLHGIPLQHERLIPNERMKEEIAQARKNGLIK